jgi:DNA polymerase-1
MPDNRLFLIDAYALIYRSYYAFIKNPRINSKGINTSAAFGFTLALEELLRKEDPSHIAVVFDPGGLTFRNNLYEAYKANRPPMPEELRASIPYIRKIIEAFRIPMLELAGYEADDVIGTLAKQSVKKGYSVFMMTPDKDYIQLVDEKIRILKPRRSGNDVEVIGPEEVHRDFGIDRPEQFIDILALWGDTADNVPGAPGIGEKTAKDLIKRYGSIDGIYEHLDELKGKQKESLINFRDQVMLARELVTICLTVPIDINPDDLNRQKPDERMLRSVFEELEFRNLLGKVMQAKPPVDLFASAPEPPVQESLFAANGLIPAGGQPVSIQSTEHQYHLVTQIADIEALAKQFISLGSFCFDTETTGLDALKAELVGLALSCKTGEASYIHFPDDRAETLRMLQPFKAVLADPSIGKTGQNLKYDIQVLANYDICINGPLFDTMLAHYLLNPDERHNLNYLADKYLDYKMVPIEELIGEKGKDQRSMRTVDPLLQKEYAGEDADITFRLRPILEQQLETVGLADLFRNVEMPLVPVLASMERAGVRLDKMTLADISLGLSEEIETLEKEIIDIAGMPFNVASPKQLGEVLFEHLKLDPQAKRTKSGQFSTGEEILTKLAHRHPVVNKILEFRGLTKLLNTYIDTLPDLVDSGTGKIHTHFNQAVTATGRLSSINPNMQNIPIREERGREIRRAFVASDAGHTILSADYSQIELRIMAHMSRDENMIAAFNRNEDIHTATAALINRVRLDQVTREMRSKAKVANFGIIYGISSFGLSQRLNISRSEAKEFIDGYFRSYPGIKLYMDHCIRLAREQGYVTTIMGRRRYLPDILSENQIVRGMSERNAINSPIQGSAADIIKLAMIRIHGEMEKLGFRSRLVLQVHDELNFDVYLPELNPLREIVRHEMEHVVQLRVPLVIDMGEGRNWLEAHG